MIQLNSFLLEKLKIDKNTKNIEPQNILNCSKVKYSIIIVENDKIDSKVFEDYNDLLKFVEKIYEGQFDNIEETIDNGLVMNGSLLLKQDEKTYQIISCFDKERN